MVNFDEKDPYFFINYAFNLINNYYFYKKYLKIYFINKIKVAKIKIFKK